MSDTIDRLRNWRSDDASGSTLAAAIVELAERVERLEKREPKKPHALRLYAGIPIALVERSVRPEVELIDDAPEREEPSVPELAEAGQPLAEAAYHIATRALFRHRVTSAEKAFLAHEIVAHIERSLPSRGELIAEGLNDEPAWRTVRLFRAHLGLDAGAPEREEPSEPRDCPDCGATGVSRNEDGLCHHCGGKGRVEPSESRLASIVRRSCDAIGIGIRPDELADEIMKLAEENDALRKQARPEPERNARQPSQRLAAAISFARDAWPNDGAEGETVHLLCDALEAMTARPEPDAPSVEAVRATIVAHAGAVDTMAAYAIARAIVASYGAPPTVTVELDDDELRRAYDEGFRGEGRHSIRGNRGLRAVAETAVAWDRARRPAVPILALPSVEEVARVLSHDGRDGQACYWHGEARAVLELIRSRQPAAFREALAQLRSLPEDERVGAGSWSLSFPTQGACDAAANLLEACASTGGER